MDVILISLVFWDEPSSYFNIRILVVSLDRSEEADKWLFDVMNPGWKT
jgi:hypothetical protein